MSQDLLLAILAMDSYNRGYNPGTADLSDAVGTQIGTATLSSNLADTVASFYAQSYTLANGETVISYRGTDQPLPSWEKWTLGDIVNGWTVGAGFPEATQARLAVEFYRSVAGVGTDPRAANITLTGHSLGGGLAGFIGTLYGKTAVDFDNMPFEDAGWIIRDSHLFSPDPACHVSPAVAGHPHHAPTGLSQFG